jgi:aryl-alcohol dehydrogenase-like predicted oxidoreductase
MPMNRREFLSRSATVVGAAMLAPAVAAKTKGSASDLVPLGRTGLKITRLGLGTGSNNGEVQRGLGAAGFDRLIRSAFERGITFIDTADNYKTHTLVASAIRGLPREQLFIQSKMPWHLPEYREKTLEVLDRYRHELGVEYIDSLLIHCTTEASWPDDLSRMMDALSDAKEKGIIKAKGVSCHGLHPLRRATHTDWVDVHLVRVNPQGRHVDTESNRWEAIGNIDTVMNEVRTMHARGRGIIGMKLAGNGDFRNPADRDRALRFAMTCGYVHAVTIGFSSVEELDDARMRIEGALA